MIVSSIEVIYDTCDTRIWEKPSIICALARNFSFSKLKHTKKKKKGEKAQLGP